LQTEFATLHHKLSPERFSNEKLVRRMEKKGFKRFKNNESPRQLYYPKIKCEYAI
jgi:hypothetical protein